MNSKLRQRLDFAIDPFVLSRVNKSIYDAFLNWANEPRFKDIRSLSEDQMKEHLASEWARAKDLDDKLNKITAALSIAATVGGVLGKTITDGLAPSGWKAATIVLLLLAMAVFLWGAFIGFSGLRPKERFGYSATFLKKTGPGSEKNERKKEYQRALCGYQTINLMRSNEATVATSLIRTGIVVFAAAICLSVVAPSDAGKGSDRRPPTVLDNSAPAIERPSPDPIAQ